jgi:putative spermidine/putrescine transport system substrate-binding protein
MLRPGYQFGGLCPRGGGGNVAFTKFKAVLLAGVTTVGLTAVSVTGSAATVHNAKATTVNWATVTHLTASGETSYSALVKAAEKEGHLNVIGLPTNWANYGTIMNDFSAKFHIAITGEDPLASSAEELSAIETDAGRSDDPDVVDVGQSFAVEAAQEGLFAPYRVLTWDNIPSSLKDSNGDWFSDYGGYVAIGCDSKTVKHCPTSFKQVLGTGHGYKVGIFGNPTEASAAFAAVFAAALANGGSLNNIKPGVDYFQRLNKEGNFVPVVADVSTVESGATNVVIGWDYLQVGSITVLHGWAKRWKINIPSDALYAAYYAQAINKAAPDPAAARLWEEYLYSTTGQNLWLEGAARPVELPYLVAHRLANKAVLAALPPIPRGVTSFPTLAQLTVADAVVAKWWPIEVTSGP